MMLKKILGVISVCAAMVFAAAPSSSKQMAVGGWVQGGNPGEHAGIDFMMRQSEQITWDIYAHFYFSDGDNSLGLYFGYYWNFYLNAPADLGRMGLYVGPTAGIGIWDEEYWWFDEFGIAVRLGVVGGFQWEFPAIPLQIYLELSPVGEFHYLSWDGYDHPNYDPKKDEYEYDYRDGDDVDWKLPDFYLRLGFRVWF